MYYIGKDYIEDKDSESVNIETLFHSPAYLEPFDFYVNGKKIYVSQKGGVLTVSFDQVISKKLIQDLMWGKSDQFIIGYIAKYLPAINGEILKQRYVLGHFLVKTFSTFDIQKVNLVVPSLSPEIKSIFLNWPPAVESFEPVKNQTKEIDKIYFRDYIDAGQSYLAGNYDDCIRKSITSVENAIIHFKLKPKNNPNNNSLISRLNFFSRQNHKFGQTIYDNLYAENLGNKFVTENILFLYKLRNKIVHDKFRVRHENGWICKKAIGTLHYLYQYLSTTNEASEFSSYLGAQFLMLDNLQRGINLDTMKKLNEQTDKDIYIDSPEKMDQFMFDGLKISPDEQKIVLKNRIPPNYYS